VISGERAPYEDASPLLSSDDYSAYQESDLPDDEGTSSHSEVSSDGPEAVGYPATISDDSQTEVQARWSTIVNILDRLFKLAIKIRKPSARSDHAKRDIFKDYFPDNRDEMKIYLEQMEAMRVEDLLKQIRRDMAGETLIPENQSDRSELVDEDLSLCRRLGRANASRRAQFACWRSRRGKEPRTGSIASRIIRNFDLGPGIGSRRSPQSDVQGPILGDKSTIAPSKTSSVSRLDPRIDYLDTQSEISKVTRTPSARGLKGEKIDWPAFPKDLVGGKEFECPYCCAVCPRHYSEAAAWK
jgi:hypothetical protein